MIKTLKRISLQLWHLKKDLVDLEDLEDQVAQVDQEVLVDKVVILSNNNKEEVTCSLMN